MVQRTPSLPDSFFVDSFVGVLNPNWNRLSRPSPLWPWLMLWTLLGFKRKEWRLGKLQTGSKPTNHPCYQILRLLPPLTHSLNLITIKGTHLHQFLQ